ncbi:two-component sensor histidine kinase BarA [Colwellia sp. Arc7-635]|uniref:two-component sensor histidine kinase BarA n=1 Tax=Colwellia sp. Arc7-635 TaxID=2497879 RepID=UPI000F85A09C|nr:two-component sensor histidine kinase BarA [Colwellia sp. Arc7-635]AZQ83351.1 two-component sensor histidine kinase BarA [Colwellia sp. Arc7-635]
MHKISLKDWVILLTIVPTTIISLIVAGYLSYSRYSELDQFIYQRATSIITPLAISSVAPLLEKKRSTLRTLIGFSHRSQSDIIKSIAIFTKDNQVFVTSAYHGDTHTMRIKAGQSLPNRTMYDDYGDYLVYRAPIIDEFSEKDDSATLDAESDIIGYIAVQIDKSSIRYAQQQLLITAFFIVLAGIIISALFTYKLINSVTRPIASMVLAIDRIREGKIESRISGQLIGELNFLKNGVNTMAQSLGDYQDEMQRSIDQATIDLRESLEQFEIQNVELDIAKRKAQDANKVKSEFLANMSHELRTPLNGVIGFTRQVLKTPLSDTQRDHLQTIERSAGNLLSIINDILDFSKLDAGKMVIESIPFSIRESIEETLTLLAPSAHKKNIELSLRVSPKLPDSLIGDAMRIKQVMVNLASNAIKFTDKGSVDINIEGNSIGQHLYKIRVTVQDTGIGIPEQQKSSIFEAFGQGDKSVTRIYGGTGLGLVISQRLVSELRGSIGFDSIETKGSTFWFTFQCELNPIPTLQLPVPANLSGKSILYYEPHAASRLATTEILTSWQMQITCITQRSEMDELLSEPKDLSSFDFALIGHDVTPSALNEVKQFIFSLKGHIPSIHLAINSNSPSLHEALISSGAKNCISKPITVQRLSKTLMPSTIELSTLVDLPEHKVPIKVLAVDDNEANLKLIKELLLEQVNEVLTASDGAQAVELCRHEKFALIFMDIQMPVLDGISALSIIRQQTLNEHTPIIAVTAHVFGEEKDKLLEEGFNSFMTKPIDEAMLHHSIYEYCDSTLLANSPTVTPVVAEPISSLRPKIIDWPLALQRAGQKSALAKDMFIGLVNSLPESKVNISEALISQDIEQLKVLIHKLNGACCYSGVPNLGKVTHELETELKRGIALDDLEPEFFEFFEQIDLVLEDADAFIKKLKNK